MGYPPQKVLGVQRIAEAMVWLGSQTTSFVTGQTMAVDGGFVAR